MLRISLVLICICYGRASSFESIESTESTESTARGRRKGFNCTRASQLPFLQVTLHTLNTLTYPPQIPRDPAQSWTSQPPHWRIIAVDLHGRLSSSEPRVRGCRTGAPFADPWAQIAPSAARSQYVSIRCLVMISISAC